MISDDRREHRPHEGHEDDLMLQDSTPPRDSEARAPGRISWRLVRRIVGSATLGLLGLAALILWPLLSAPDPDASARLVDLRLMGETSGYVARVDRDTQTVDVSANLFGLRAVPLVVNGETVITVRDRLGGFGDLWKDLPVRASYEIRGDTRFARSIEVLTGAPGDAPKSANGAAGPPPIRPSAALPPSAPPPAVEPSLPARAAISPSASRPEPATVVEPRAHPEPAPETPAERPAPRARPTASNAQATQPARPSRPVAASRETSPPRPSSPDVASRATSAPRPGESSEGDVADGTAIIDWLLKESRRQ